MTLPSPYSLTEMSTRIISGGTGGRCLRLTSLQASYLDFLKIWERQPFGTFWVSRCLYRDFLSFTGFMFGVRVSTEISNLRGGGEFWSCLRRTDRLWVSSRYYPVVLSTEVKLATVYVLGTGVMKPSNGRFYLSSLLVLSLVILTFWHRSFTFKF
jgi:hypothetical protein